MGCVKGDTPHACVRRSGVSRGLRVVSPLLNLTNCTVVLPYEEVSHWSDVMLDWAANSSGTFINTLLTDIEASERCRTFVGRCL